MNDVVIVEVFNSLHNLFEKVNCFVFVELSFFLEVMIQVVIAYLSNDVHVVVSLKDIIEMHNILMTYLLHYLYL